MKIALGILIGIGLVVGISAFANNGWIRVSSEEDWEVVTTYQSFPLKGIRFHDDEKNATCWAVEDYEGGSAVSGISCLPDSQLK